MNDENKKDEPKVQADNNSIAVGNISAGGNIGDIKINTGYSADQVSVLITQIQSTFQPNPFDGRCPYKGLDVFEEEDAELFFGREKLVDDLTSRVMNSRTVFVTGPSGSGKSSLVRAGLIHALKQGAIKGSDRWLYATMKPGRDPIGELGRVASSLAGTTSAEDEIRTKAMTDATIFARWCEIALKEGRDKRFVLFIDQFEEAFTQINNEEERAAFLNLLTHAVTVENGRMIILFSMRSDFVSNCATYPQLNAILNQQFIQIGAMQPEELVSAIAQPALRVGLRIDPDLIAQIINEMKGEPGALPLMQFALKDLFDSQQEKSGVIALTLNDYLQRGGIHKALERHADDSFSKLSKHEQEMARSIFSGLIEIGRGTQDTRRTALFDELVPVNSKAKDVEAIVQKLADARLITTDEQAGKDTVTISHEKLIDAWPWLKKLVNENRDLIALQNEIAGEAKDWNNHNRDTSYLYTGVRLANSLEKLGEKKLVLNGLAQEFVKASFALQEQEERVRSRLRRRITSGLVAVTLTLAVLSIIAFISYRVAEQERGTALFEKNRAVTAQSDAEAARTEAEKQQKIATIRQWSSQSLSFKELLPQQSLLLAVQAISQTMQHKLIVPEAEEALRQVLTTAGGIPFHSHKSSVYTVTFSPSGQYALTVDATGEAELSKIADPQAQPFTFSVSKNSSADVIFSPEEDLLVAPNSENDKIFLDVWNISEQSKQRVALTGTNITDIRFSPDGQYLITAVTGTEPEREQLWKVKGSTVSPLTLPGNALMFSHIAFSSHANYLFTEDQSGTESIWSVKDLSVPLMTLPNSEKGLAATFSPDEKFLATWQSGQIGLAQLWDFRHPNAPPLDLSVKGLGMWSLVFSPDGQYLITQNHNGVFARNTTNPMAPAVNLSENMEDVGIDATFSPDGRFITVQGWYSGFVRVWRMDNLSRPLAELKGYQEVVFSPKSQFLLLADDIGLEHVLVMDDPTRAPILLTGVNRNSAPLMFSPDDRFIAATSGNLMYLWQTDNIVARSWERQTDAPATLRGHDSGIFGAFSPDSRYLVTGDRDGDVRLWGLDGFFMWPSLLSNDSNRILDVVFSPDKKYILALQNDGTALLWYTVNPTAPATVVGGRGEAITSAEFSYNSHFLVTYDNSYHPKVWKIEKLTVTPLSFGGPENNLNSVELSPNENYLIGISSDRQRTVFLDLQHPSSGPVALQKDVWPCCVRTISPDGKYVVRVTDNTIFLHSMDNLNASASQLTSYPPTDNDTHIDVMFSPDGRYLLTRLIDPPGTLTSGGGTPWTDLDETAHLWNMKDLSAPSVPVSRIANESTLGMAFSPSGQMLATRDFGGVVWLWNLNGPSPMRTALRGSPKGVSVIAFSPDEHYFLIGGVDGAVRLWDMEKLDSVPTVLLSQEGAVTKVEFSPDQSTLLVGNGDINSIGGYRYTSIIRLWHMDALDIAPVVMSDVSDGAFSPDGRYLLTRSNNNGVRLMSLDVTKLMDLACTIAARNLSWDEWQRFIGDVPYNQTCPKLPPHPTVAPALVALGEEYAWQGNIEKARSAFQEALQVDPSFTIPASSWNDLCWFGSLISRAVDVLDACTKAVEMEPDNGKYRDSRGLARVLSNDLPGAIEDFDFVVRWARANEYTKMGAERQSWLDALKSGQNPFSSELLAALRLE